MHVTGLRALCAVPIAAGFRKIAEPAARHRFRPFHHSRSLENALPAAPDSSAGAADGKPPEKPVTDITAGDQPAGETAPRVPILGGEAVRQSRRSLAASKNRGPKARVAEELPPVNIPDAFWAQFLRSYDAAERIDVFDKPRCSARDFRSLQQALKGRTSHATCAFLIKLLESLEWPDTTVNEALRLGKLDILARRSRLMVEILDWLTWSHLPHTTPPAEVDVWERATPMDDLPKDFVLPYLLSSQINELRTATIDSLRWEQLLATADFEIADAIEHGRYPLPADMDATSFFDVGQLEPVGLQEAVRAIRADLALRPPPPSPNRQLKRPVTVISMRNYVGNGLSAALIRHAGTLGGASVLKLKAQELALLVGVYLGQDWPYTRGAISMLGFRVGEVSGRMSRYSKSTGPHMQDDAKDFEEPWLSIQTAASDAGRSVLEDELQKIRDGAKDYILPSVDRWENLKINNVLETMVRGALWQSTAAGSDKLIIHVEDYVELNMVLEGALLLGRLRSIVDNLWRDGLNVVLVGTSSTNYKAPSHQPFTAALRDISAEDNVVVAEAGEEWVSSSARTFLEGVDYREENLLGLRHMINMMCADPAPIVQFSLDVLTEGFQATIAPWKFESDLGELIPTELWSLSDVYQLARKCIWLYKSLGEEAEFKVPTGAAGMYKRLGSAWQAPASLEDGKADDKAAAEEPKPKPAQKKKAYTEHERKLLSGLINKDEIRTTFADVHAPPSTIQALKLLTSLSLVRPEAFSYGVLATDRIPGCLLYGPPGTGKTLLAKAVAKESGASMLEVSGASINDMWVGNSEKNVRALFTLAKKLAPLVIFIDEADALLAARQSRKSAGGRGRETINQFLREWDGMSDTKAFIMVATNRPFDLDEAVLRRLPRKILVDLPLQADRAAILGLLLKDERMADDVDLDDIARRTPLYSGSDLKNLGVAAAMAAVQEENEEAARHASASAAAADSQGADGVDTEPYVFPERRTLHRRHFDKALAEIGASISEDMESLKEIQKFDEKFGSAKQRRRRRKSMGFEVVPPAADSHEARVRRDVGF